MSRIYHIVNYLGYLAGFACVLMITVAVYKILTGNEMEYRRYLTRIRNGIVALKEIIWKKICQKLKKKQEKN